MREIVLDTETTGFDPETGDRIVEIGAVELMNHLPTGRTYHQYINPERPMPKEAFDVHGLGDDFLRDKPKFAQIVQDFVDFIGDDAKLVIHNAQFDMKFLNAELKWAGHRVMPYSRAVDTLEIARSKFPGAQNSLDALCRRFRIDNSNRTLHGARGNATARARRVFSARWVGDDATFADRGGVTSPPFPELTLKDGEALVSPLFPRVWPRE